MLSCLNCEFLWLTQNVSDDSDCVGLECGLEGWPPTPLAPSRSWLRARLAHANRCPDYKQEKLIPPPQFDGVIGEHLG